MAAAITAIMTANGLERFELAADGGAPPAVLVEVLEVEVLVPVLVVVVFLVAVAVVRVLEPLVEDPEVVEAAEVVDALDVVETTVDDETEVLLAELVEAVELALVRVSVPVADETNLNLSE